MTCARCCCLSAVMQLACASTSSCGLAVAGTHHELVHHRRMSHSQIRLREPIASKRIMLHAARLTFLHRRFAPEWLRLKHLYPDLARRNGSTGGPSPRPTGCGCGSRSTPSVPTSTAWSRTTSTGSCGTIRPTPRASTGWIASCPSGNGSPAWLPPPSVRLKEGKWSAESAAKLSNDEFFEIIGIPEMTTGASEPADPQARRLPPLEARRVRHRRSPPRLDLGRLLEDAVALLGSEEAVREYVEGKKEQATEEPSQDGATDLFGQRLPPKQKRLF